MNKSEITIHLDAQRATYHPGDVLSGHFIWSAEEVESIELSILWHTEGKGDEDLGVHHFERWSRAEDNLPALGRAQQFQIALPSNPLSYDGVAVKICWSVRVRALGKGRSELMCEQPFRLGTVSPAQEVVRK